MTAFAPICLFTFNRLAHTRETIGQLLKNAEAAQSELFVFSDGARNDGDTAKVQELRGYLKTVTGFKKVTVIEREKNMGLARSIIDGVSQIVQKHGRVIVLEDDLVTSPYFLKYMNEALELYQNDRQVASIHGYVYPIENLPETFFLKGADCWGWATWADRWSKFNPDGKSLLAQLEARKLTKEFDYDGSYPYVDMLKKQIEGKNNSWAIRWYASAFLADMVTLYPGKSLVFNIGNDSSGTHCATTDEYDVELLKRPIQLTRISTEPNGKARSGFVKYFKKIKRSRMKRVFQKIRSQLGL